MSGRQLHSATILNQCPRTVLTRLKSSSIGSVQMLTPTLRGVRIHIVFISAKTDEYLHASLRAEGAIACLPSLSTTVRYCRR
jgi:hypothetical protein